MADRLMPAVGLEVTAAERPAAYEELLGAWVIDERDRASPLASKPRGPRRRHRHRDARRRGVRAARSARAGRRAVTARRATGRGACGVEGLPEVRAGDDLASLLVVALRDLGVRDGDVVVVTSKIVSKAEGRLVRGRRSRRGGGRRDRPRGRPPRRPRDRRDRATASSARTRASTPRTSTPARSPCSPRTPTPARRGSCAPGSSRTSV